MIAFLPSGSFTKNAIYLVIISYIQGFGRRRLTCRPIQVADNYFQRPTFLYLKVIPSISAPSIMGRSAHLSWIDGDFHLIVSAVLARVIMLQGLKKSLRKNWALSVRSDSFLVYLLPNRYTDCSQEGIQAKMVASPRYQQAVKSALPTLLENFGALDHSE